MAVRQTGSCKIETFAFMNDYEDWKDNINEEIKRLREEEDATLRDLEEYVNVSILRLHMDEANMDYLSGDPENIYHLLTDDEEVSPRERDQAIDHLEEGGVDVEEVQENFVSYQTIRSHVNECLGISTSTEKEDADPQEKKDTIDRLQSRTEAVVQRTIEQLQKEGELDISDDVSVSSRTTVTCNKCGRSYSVSGLFNQEGCDCSS